MKTNDFFAHNMQICRPIFLEQAIIIRTIAKGRDIICQSIHPNIQNVFWVVFHRNAPIKRGSTDAQIFQTWLDKIAKNLIFSRRRNDKIWILLIKFNQPILIFFHIKKVRLFLHQLHFSPTIWTFSVHQLGPA